MCMFVCVCMSMYVGMCMFVCVCFSNELVNNARVCG